MSYKLKQGQEPFTPSEGPFAGRTFTQGANYAEIPQGPEMERRFERVYGNPAAARAEGAPKPIKIKGAQAPEKPDKQDKQDHREEASL